VAQGCRNSKHRKKHFPLFSVSTDWRKNSIGGIVSPMLLFSTGFPAETGYLMQNHKKVCLQGRFH